MKKEEIDNIFTYHPPQPEEIVTYTTLREMGKTVATTINNICPDSIEKTKSIQKIEEAIMWANAAVARHNKK